MGLHPAALATPRSHWAPSRQRPTHLRGHPVCADCRLPVARSSTRVRRTNNRVAAAQALGRGGGLGAHLAGCARCLHRQGKLDWTIAFLDGSFVPAKQGGEKVGLTRKGKGTKWRLVVDGNGLPLGCHLDGADCAEVQLARQTLDTIRVARPRGRPKRWPKKLVADRGYDSSDLRHLLRCRGIRRCIPAQRRPNTWRAKRGRPVVARKEDYQQRYKVERSFAWLGNFRRLLIRWEHQVPIYRGFFTVALALVCVKRLVPSASVRQWSITVTAVQ